MLGAAAMPRRSLRPAEQLVADDVFQGTVPYSRVRVTDSLGLHNRPYTLVMSGGDEGEDLWHLNVGPLFQGMQTTPDGQRTLVHELTHVWQSAHGISSAAYMFNSVWHQVVDDDAYNYTPGKSWTDYNVEQQAHIVEDWFARGKKVDDPNFRYIRDNIRTAQKLK